LCTTLPRKQLKTYSLTKFLGSEEKKALFVLLCDQYFLSMERAP